MLNVQDECDLPEDDGYDLFTRETEVERRRWDELRFGTSCRSWRRSRMAQLVRLVTRAALYGAK
ncbi:MAG: hypothetical protein ACHP8B_11530 [Terriglobales bacterium]